MPSRRERLLKHLVGRYGGELRGVVLTHELAAHGFDRRAVQRLLAGARLVRLYRGAYSLFDPPQPFARELAALRLLGPSAALSHDTAAWCMGALAERPAEVVVTLPPVPRIRSRDGLRIHHSAIGPGEWWTRDSLRMTTPARTAIDLAATGDAAIVRGVVNELVALRLTSAARLRAAAQRERPRQGTRRLIRVIDGGTIGDYTKYRGENRLAEAIRRSPVLPVPERNVWLHGWEIDFLWREAGFYIELDGGAVHSTPEKFESDRRRDAELQIHGWIGQRVTWLQTTRATDETVSRIERGYELAAANATKLTTIGSN